MNEIEYCMVIDANGKKLAPTRKEKAWYKIRHKKAILLQKCPMAIQLNKVVNSEDPTTYVMGIDDGTKHVGGAIIQRCKTKHKVLFLAQVDLRGGKQT